MGCPNCATPITDLNRGIKCLDCGSRFCAICEKDYRKPRKAGERAYCAKCYDTRVEVARGAPAEVLVVHSSGKPLAYRRGEFLIGEEWGGEAVLLDAAKAYLPGSGKHVKRGGKLSTPAGEILVERGKHLVIAARFATAPPKDAREKLVALGRGFETSYKGRIEGVDEPLLRLEGADGILDQLYTPGPKARPPAPPPPPSSSRSASATPGGQGVGPPPPPPPPQTRAAPENEAISVESGRQMRRSEWFQKGLEADRRQRYDEAVEFYDKAISEESTNVTAWFNKGVALQMLERNDEALRCYDRALVIDPGDSEIWCNKGLALRAIGQLKEAIHCYDSALELDPDDASVWSNKGVALRITGDVEGAISCYDRALKLAPTDAGIWSNKAVALQVLGRYEEAMRCLEKALEISPTKLSARKNLELVRRQLRRRK